MRVASSAYQRKKFAAYAISAFDSATGLPISSVMRSARSSVRSVMRSYARRRMSPRSRGGWLRNSWKVSCAAASAASASSPVASATSTSVSPVAGSSTGIVPPSPPSRHWPPMYSWVLTPSRTACSADAVVMSRDYPSAFVTGTSGRIPCGGRLRCWSAPPRSRLDEDLDRLAVGHRAVAVGHAVEVGRGVQDLPRLDGAVEDVGHQLLDVGADRRRPAGQADVVAEQAAEADRCLLVLRHPDAADRAARTDDPEGLLVGGQVADRLEDHVRAFPA